MVANCGGYLAEYLRYRWVKVDAFANFFIYGLDDQVSFSQKTEMTQRD
jgi:hypothetical protein